MVAGALIVLAILQACAQEALTVSDAGLLEGVLLDLAG
jgi:exopolyphosphatase/pppGpp-phosphohydrolase